MQEIIIFSRINSQAPQSEEFISDLFSKLTGNALHRSECDSSLVDERDETMGQFPFMVYKHWFVPKQFIFGFWLSQTDIETKVTLSFEERTQVEFLNKLLQSRMNLLVVSKS